MTDPRNIIKPTNSLVDAQGKSLQKRAPTIVIPVPNLLENLDKPEWIAQMCAQAKLKLEKLPNADAGCGILFIDQRAVRIQAMDSPLDPTVRKIAEAGQPIAGLKRSMRRAIGKPK